MAHNPLLGDKWQGLVEKKNGALNWTGKIKLFPDALEIPLRRKKPTTYFVDSKADLFHPKVPFEDIDKVWCMMFDCINIENNPVVLYAKSHTFLILTKRIKRLLEFAEWKKNKGERIDYPNIHFGVSISNPDEMWKVTELSRIPAAVRWISFEPLLADVGEIPLTSCRVDRVVVGGESGKGAKPMQPSWARNIRDQCVNAGIPFFMKQMGGHPNKRAKLEDIPEDLRIRELI
jgi:protein gp37